MITHIHRKVYNEISIYGEPLWAKNKVNLFDFYDEQNGNIKASFTAAFIIH